MQFVLVMAVDGKPESVTPCPSRVNAEARLALLTEKMVHEDDGCYTDVFGVTFAFGIFEI